MLESSLASAGSRLTISSSDCTTTSVFGGVAASAVVERAARINSGKTLAFIDVFP
ncbi:hypothetical protein D3C76_1538310 [compost metagenome]